MSEPDSSQPNRSIERILSVPALAAALRRSDDPGLAATAQTFFANTLVPMYKIDDRLADAPADEEAAAVAKVVSDVSERLRRMGTAYGEWETFDGSAYFDLLPEQYEWLITTTERVSTVNVNFYVDLLIPSFRSATVHWLEHFVPAYHLVHLNSLTEDAAEFAAFFESAQPKMVAHWERLLVVVQKAREILGDDIGWMATNGGQEERFLHRDAWQQPIAEHLDSALTPSLQIIPTLIRSFEFTLPAHRQSGRLQRLRRNRERARRDEQRAV